MVRLTASSFEIMRNSDQPPSNSAQQHSLSGYVCIDDNNSKSFQMLKDLCSGDALDEVVVVYREYAFSLIGVSFIGNNTDRQGADRTFKFHAKDVHLEELFGL